MSIYRFTFAAIALSALVSLGGCVVAQNSAEHAQHNSAGAAPTAKSGATSAVSDTEVMAKMDGHMRTMREMHAKMAAAKNPEERKALMEEHMKVMREGMTMMRGMSAGDGHTRGMAGMMGGGSMPPEMGQRHRMMEKHMEMMQTMMQMMMDHMVPMPAK